MIGIIMQSGQPFLHHQELGEQVVGPITRVVAFPRQKTGKYPKRNWLIYIDRVTPIGVHIRRLHWGNKALVKKLADRFDLVWDGVGTNGGYYPRQQLLAEMGA